MIAFALAHTAFILVELAAEGLVKFLDNPKHRRSKLLRLTGVGEARYRELDAKLLAIARPWGSVWEKPRSAGRPVPCGSSATMLDRARSDSGLAQGGYHSPRQVAARLSVWPDHGQREWSAFAAPATILSIPSRLTATTRVETAITGATSGVAASGHRSACKRSGPVG